MSVSILGSRSVTLPDGWTKESSVSILGSAKVGARASTPGPDAKLSAFSLFGSTRVVVPVGARVTLRGFSLLGSKTLKVTPGDGPAISITGNSILGSTSVVQSGS